MGNKSSDIVELREALFDTLRDLRAGKIDAEKARAINDTAQVIVNTAKVEIDYLRATGATKGTEFIPSDRDPVLPDGTTVVSQKPGVTVTRHQLKG